MWSAPCVCTSSSRVLSHLCLRLKRAKIILVGCAMGKRKLTTDLGRAASGPVVTMNSFLQWAAGVLDMEIELVIRCLSLSPGNGPPMPASALTITDCAEGLLNNSGVQEPDGLDSCTTGQCLPLTPTIVVNNPRRGYVPPIQGRVVGTPIKQPTTAGFAK